MTTESIREAAPRLPIPLPSGDARRDARAMADLVRLVVPDLIGLSLVERDADSGRARTLAATGDDVALLDALQYLTGATISSRPPSTARWVHLGAGHPPAPWGALVGASGADVGAALAVAAEAGSAPGAGGRTVHLYARRAEGPAEAQTASIATAVAAWASRLGAGWSVPGVVADASLPPEQEPLGRQGDTARAVARVAIQQGVDVAVARASLHDAARRAGLPDHRLTRVLAHPARRRRP